MDLTNYYDKNRLKGHMAPIKKIFFYRVCGTGMGAAASLLQQMGFHVEGGDHKFGPPMSTYLEHSGVKCHFLDDLDESFLKEFDLIIVGNVVTGAGEEARKIEKLGVPFASFPSTLGALVLDKIPHVVGIAGTHGKTTTTYLAVQLFENLGEKPGYLIGGVVEGREAATQGEGKYFFIESDEYETSYFEKFSKFRNYSLNHMVITSLEFDHADFFADMQSISDEFNYVLPTIDKTLILNRDYSEIQKLDLPRSKVSWYGQSSEQGPMITQMSAEGSEFTVIFHEQKYLFKTNLIGTHNIENLTSVILFALAEGFSAKDIQSSIEKLKMVKRRQEIRGTYKGAIVIDDFAHHPKAVEVTLDSLRIKYPNKRMVVVFGASSATARSDLFQDEFAQGLAIADEVIIVKPEVATSVRGAGNLDSEQVQTFLINKGVESSITYSLEELLTAIAKRANKDSVIVVLSNSNCSGLWESRFTCEIE